MSGGLDELKQHISDMESKFEKCLEDKEAHTCKYIEQKIDELKAIADRLERIEAKIGDFGDDDGNLMDYVNQCMSGHCSRLRERLDELEEVGSSKEESEESEEEGYSCPKCGAELKGVEEKCPSCGEPIKWKSVEEEAKKEDDDEDEEDTSSEDDEETSEEEIESEEDEDK